MIATLAAGLLLGLQFQGDSWGPLWDQLDRLRAGEAPAADGDALATRLESAARAQPEDPRGQLLDAALRHRAGADVAAAAERLASLEPDPFDAREHWYLIELLRPGPRRGQLVRSALEESPELARPQLLLAWKVALDEARSLRFEQGALPIQRELYRRNPADWSAIDLALSLRLTGDFAGADRVLAEALEREAQAGRPGSELWFQRGRTALGSGDEARARDYLGKALALGSREANLALSRLDLIEGHLEAARRGFRTSILDSPPADWAWRGWGASLLPSPFAPPARRPPGPTRD